LRRTRASRPTSAPRRPRSSVRSGRATRRPSSSRSRVTVPPARRPSASACNVRSNDSAPPGGRPMVPMTEARLERRARWAYELGRAAWASHALLLVLPLLLVARLIGRPSGLVFILGGAVAALGFGGAMVHRRYSRAVLAGVLASLPAFALPVIIRSLGIVRLGPMTLDPCIPASIVAGILAGAYLAARTVAEKHRPSYWLVAALVA